MLVRSREPHVPFLLRFFVVLARISFFEESCEYIFKTQRRLLLISITTNTNTSIIFLFNWFFFPPGTFSIMFATFVLVCRWKVDLMFAQLLLNWLNIHCSTEIVSKSCFFLVLPLILLLCFSRPSALEGFSNNIFAARLNYLTQFSTLYQISAVKLYLISLGYHFLLKYLKVFMFVRLMNSQRQKLGEKVKFHFHCLLGRETITSESKEARKLCH